MTLFRLMFALMIVPVTLTACSTQVTPPGEDTPPAEGDGDPGTDPQPDPVPGSDPDPLPEPAGPTSLGMIDEALSSGEIDETDALRYKMFAVFGDERLPDSFAGEVRFRGTDVLLDAVEQWDRLSPEVQDELLPFFLPPDAEGSWYERQILNGKIRSASSHLFDTLEAAEGDVLIRWPTNLPGLAGQAETIKQALEGTGGFKSVWYELTALMGREPLSDEGLDEDYNGGDGRFDIFVVRNPNVTTPHLQGCFGWASPYAPETGFFADLTADDRRAAYLVLNDDVNSDDDELRGTFAHEFMHVLQFTFDAPRTAFREWLSESTATWAEHFVYPAADSEHIFTDDYLDVPERTLTNDAGSHEYGGYLFWLYVTGRFSDDSVIRSVWERLEGDASINAANDVLPGGFAEIFPDFAVTNWNDKPYNEKPPYTALADDLITDRVKVTPKQLKITGRELDEEIVFDGGGVARLSAQYFHYDLTDTSLRSILFANGYTFNLDEGIPSLFQGTAGDESHFATRLEEDELEGRRVFALVKQNGTWAPDPFDLTEIAFAAFCQEAAAESIDELVLIFVNAEHRTDKPAFALPRGMAPRLFLTEIGCGAWKGSGKHTYKVSEADEQTTAVTTFKKLEFTRDTTTLEEIMAGGAQLDFGFGGAEIVPAGTVGGTSLLGGEYRLADIEATWTHQSVYNEGRCTENGSGSITLGEQVIGVFNVAPLLTDTAGSSEIPSLYQSFYIEMFFVDSDEPIQKECRQPDGDITTSETSFGAALGGGYRNIEELGKLRLDASGNTINETWTIDDDEFELNLTSDDLP